MSKKYYWTACEYLELNCERLDGGGRMNINEILTPSDAVWIKQIIRNIIIQSRQFTYEDHWEGRVFELPLEIIYRWVKDKYDIDPYKYLEFDKEKYGNIKNHIWSQMIHDVMKKRGEQEDFFGSDRTDEYQARLDEKNKRI